LTNHGGFFSNVGGFFTISRWFFHHSRSFFHRCCLIFNNICLKYYNKCSKFSQICLFFGQIWLFFTIMCQNDTFSKNFVYNVKHDVLLLCANSLHYCGYCFVHVLLLPSGLVYVPGPPLRYLARKSPGKVKKELKLAEVIVP
jgi:hypothetical protein